MMISSAGGQGMNLSQMQGQMQGMRKPPSAEDMAQGALEHMDSDGDGAISSAESAFSEEMFAEIDADGNGIADSEELQSHAQQQIDKMESMMESGDFAGIRAMMGDMPPPPRGDMAGQEGNTGSSLTRIAANNAYAESAQYGSSLESVLLEQLNQTV